MIIKFPPSDERHLLKVYFQLLNVAQPDSSKALSEGEIRILSEFILLPEKFKYQRFGRIAKKKVIESLKEYYDWTISSLNINNRIYSMIDKEYLWRDEDSVIYVSKSILQGAQKLLAEFNDSNTASLTFNFSK